MEKEVKEEGEDEGEESEGGREELGNYLPFHML
jgi:hypothetical protein